MSQLREKRPVVPRVSVVIPTYNRAAYISEAIESALNQTAPDLEIVVVDDGSTDNTAEIVGSYGHRVRYVRQANQERAAARNTGIINASGQHIALLDSDDVWLPNHIAACGEALRRHPRAGVAYSRAVLVDEAGGLLTPMPAAMPSGDLLHRILSSCEIGATSSSTLIRREVFESVGLFDEVRELSGSEDWVMWARIATRYEFVAVPEITAKLRVHDGNTRGNAPRMERSSLKALDVLFSVYGTDVRLRGYEGLAHAAVYTLIAINYYGEGNMRRSRQFLRYALAACPSYCLNLRWSFTLLRTLLGSRLSFALRRRRWNWQRRAVKLP